MSDFREKLATQLPKLMRYATALTGDQNSAEIMVKECIERAIQKQKFWKPKVKLSVWLFTIMHNLYHDKNRNKNLSSISRPNDDNSPNIATDVQIDQFVLKSLKDSLQKLPPQEKEVLLLVGLEELQYKEVGKIIGSPVGEVIGLLDEARKKLRTCFSAQEPKLSTIAK